MGMPPLKDNDPSQLGPFRLTARIGLGGMGQVYLAERDTQKGTQQVAVKVVRDDLASQPSFRARFAQEARAAMAVSGPCTARVVALDIDSDPQWMATEYVPGPTLEHQVAHEGPLDHDQAVLLAVGLAEAVRSMAGHGVIHRDLKPANVILSPQGPKVIDLGIASALEATSLTATGMHIGSPGWMAPEQVTGDPETTATDVFGWGATVAFAALGRHPFGTGRADAIAYRVLNQPPDLEGLVAPLSTVVSAALARDPSARPSPAQVLQWLGHEGLSASGVTQLLVAGWTASDGQVSQDAPTTLRSTTPPPRPIPTPTPVGPTTPVAGTVRRRGLVIAAVVAVVLAVAVAGGAVLAKTQTSKDTASSPSASTTSSPAATTAPPSPRPQPTVTVTKSQPARTVTAKTTVYPTVYQAPPAPRSVADPAGWPPYEYYGPTGYDVCATSSYPLPSLLRAGSQPAPGTAEYETLTSAQAGLRALNYGEPGPIPVDGDFGAMTEAAARSFQRNKGLTVDGTIGPETWAALHEWLNSYAGIC